MLNCCIVKRLLGYYGLFYDGRLDQASDLIDWTNNKVPFLDRVFDILVSICGNSVGKKHRSVRKLLLENVSKLKYIKKNNGKLVVKKNCGDPIFVPPGYMVFREFRQYLESCKKKKSKPQKRLHIPDRSCLCIRKLTENVAIKVHHPIYNSYVCKNVNDKIYKMVLIGGLQNMDLFIFHSKNPLQFECSVKLMDVVENNNDYDSNVNNDSSYVNNCNNTFFSNNNNCNSMLNNNDCLYNNKNEDFDVFCDQFKFTNNDVPFLYNNGNDDGFQPMNSTPFKHQSY